MAFSPSDILAHQNPRIPWASMVIHLVDRYCFTDDTIVDADGNIGFPLTGCRRHVHRRESIIEIEILSITMAGMVITAEALLDSRSQFSICHQFTPIFRYWWKFTVDQYVPLGGNPKCIVITHRLKTQSE